MRCLLRVTVLVLSIYVVSAMGLERHTVIKSSKLEGDEAASPIPTEGFNPRAAISVMAEYIKTHPDFVGGVIAWFIVGGILWLFGFIVFLLSEIGAVLVVRDQDFREKLIAGKYMAPAQGDAYQKLTNRENMKMAPRPYLSVASVVFMFAGTSCLMYPLCDVLSIIGLPSAPCVLLITVGSFLATICNVTFLLFLIWSCTRSWAALVFLLVSFTGSILLPTGNPILLCLWIIVALGGSYAYFIYLPSTYASEAEIPPFVQNIGNFAVEPNFEKFQSAFKDVYDVTKEEIQEKYDESAKAVKAAADKVAEEAERAKKAAEDAAKASASAATGGDNKKAA